MNINKEKIEENGDFPKTGDKKERTMLQLNKKNQNMTKNENIDEYKLNVKQRIEFIERLIN